MRAQGLVADEITYNSLIAAYAKRGQPEQAQRVRRHAAQGLVADEITYNSLIAAYAKGGQPEQAQRVFDDMRARGWFPTRSRIAA